MATETPTPAEALRLHDLAIELISEMAENAPPQRAHLAYYSVTIQTRVTPRPGLRLSETTNRSVELYLNDALMPAAQILTVHSEAELREAVDAMSGLMDVFSASTLHIWAEQEVKDKAQRAYTAQALRELTELVRSLHYVNQLEELDS